MRRVVSVASAGALALLTGGCSYLSFLPWVDNPGELEGTGIVEEVPTPEASPPAEEFADPLETGGQPSVAGLVQPTNPDERIRQVQKGREDPFAVIPVQPVLIPNESPAVAPLPKISQPGSSGTGQSQVAVNRPSQAGGTEQPKAVNLPQIATPTSSQPAIPSPGQIEPPQEREIPGFELSQPEEGLQVPLPPGQTTPPQPAVASVIAVSGIVQVGTTPKAIIKAPNEDYSRYVQAGEYISNGQVLVKRIEMRGSAYPTVVFEEDGVEFARRVGAGGQTTEEVTNTPTAFVPSTPGKV